MPNAHYKKVIISRNGNATTRNQTLPNQNFISPTTREETFIESRDSNATNTPDAMIGNKDSATGVVLSFCRALSLGDGHFANSLMVPWKRQSKNFLPNSLSDFYGSLSVPLRVIGSQPIANNEISVKYNFTAGRNRCDANAVVRLVLVGDELFD